LLKEVEAARTITTEAGTALTLVEERCRNSRSALAAAVLSRDAALSVFPKGVDVALVAAQNALAAGIAEKERIEIEFASLENTITARKNRIDTALGGARTNADKAKAGVETAQGELTAAITDHASQDGRLIELRRLRDAENLAAAKSGLHEATERQAALPIPDRIVTNDEIVTAQNTVAGLRSNLDGIERDLQRAHGALEQVGGAVARERLRDATEAFELAERQEREIEAEYEAWRLLLVQMKEADAAQASLLSHVIPYNGELCRG
jgi:hypothetical protein